MKIKGIIKLIDRSGETVKAAQYQGEVNRKYIINHWKRTTGPKWSECSIQICPAIVEPLTKPDGLNARSYNRNN
jgi:hypothetical protein